MTFKTLLSKNNFSRRTYELIFHLSKQIKNLPDYLSKQNSEIDFSLQEFQTLLESDKPLERLLKNVYFYNQNFVLLDNVFCPRNETELIIELLEKKHLKGKYIDICSGTGVIGITLLKKHKELQGTLLDIDPQAIENIKLNLNKHKVEAKVIQSDWLEHLENNSYQVITANFPYIGSNDPIIEPEVLKYDPHLSLFGAKNGWEHYSKILSWMETNSNWEIVILECNDLHEDKWKTIENSKWKIQLFKDLNNLLRVALITR